MKLSNKGFLMIVEATVTTIIGLIYNPAGIALTFVLVVFHLRCEKELWHQPPAQMQVRVCPLLKALSEQKGANKQ